MSAASLSHSGMANAAESQTVLKLPEVVGSGAYPAALYRRFFDKVAVVPSSCWEWQGSLVYGYGQFYFEGRPQRAQRVAWKILRGSIPDGLQVCHTCDNPSCVNPDHLFLGTAYDNHQDMVRKGRERVGIGSRHGNHKLTEDRVRAVRLLLRDGIAPMPIARCLGVSVQTICRIRDGHGWAHVGPEPEQVA